MSKCEEITPDVLFGLNTLFHALIIFMILMIGFMSFAKRTLLDTYIIASIDNNVGPTIDNLDDNTKRTLSIISTILPLDKLKKQYASPNELAEEKFKWLQFSTTTFGIFIAVLVAIVVLVLYYACNKCVPIQLVLVENALTLVVVALVIIAFFTKPIVEYLTPSSDLIKNAVVKRLKYNLEKK
jgi:hypothetical protein